MKPIGPLMREHRLIERMVHILVLELHEIDKQGREVNPFIIDAAVDFFRTYADRTHHGKEEGILFKALENKELAPEHQKIMDELISEHVLARKTVAGLDNAVKGYAGGDHGNIKGIITNIKTLVELYPKHIEKEDKHFFYPILEYLDKNEQDAVLQAFVEFDRNMIHEKYGRVIEGLENR